MTSEQAAAKIKEVACGEGCKPSICNDSCLKDKEECAFALAIQALEEVQGRRTTMEKLNEKLKPCPFCAGNAMFKLISVRPQFNVADFKFRIMCSKCGIEYQKDYECNVCLGSDGELFMGKDERAQAISDWNRRPSL